MRKVRKKCTKRKSGGSKRFEKWVKKVRKKCRERKKNE